MSTIRTTHKSPDSRHSGKRPPYSSTPKHVAPSAPIPTTVYGRAVFPSPAPAKGLLEIFRHPEGSYEIFLDCVHVASVGKSEDAIDRILSSRLARDCRAIVDLPDDQIHFVLIDWAEYMRRLQNQNAGISFNSRSYASYMAAIDNFGKFAEKYAAHLGDGAETAEIAMLRHFG